MATEVVLPRLGLTMEEGTIVRWCKKPGDELVEGETILEIETDKVTAEVEAPTSGSLGPILAQEGMTVPVGQVITHVLAAGEQAPETQPAGVQEVTEATATADGTAPRPKGKGQKVAASPVARRIARELGVDLNTVVGTGPGGRITKEDVRQAKPVEPSIPEVEAGERQIKLLQGVRKVTAERLTQSFTTVPHFYLSVEADASSTLKMRQRLLDPVEKRAGVRFTISDLLVKITAQALEEYPEVNAVWDNGGVRDLTSIDVGLAVSTDRGLIVPVIRDANRKSLSQIAAERQGLVDKARSGNLALQDVEGGSITVSNLGTFAVDQFNAIINPPQSAILAVGQIKERPVAVNGQLTVRPTVFLTLSIDHRILDGAQAAQFLSRVVELVEEPYLLMPL